MTERKVALITGSSSGIGEALAREFAADGYAVVVNSSSSVEAGENVAASLPEAIYCQGSVASESDCTALVANTIAHFGRLDVLVNNAGTTRVIPHHDLDAATVEIWREIFEVNVFGTWAMTVAAAHALAARHGAVINITSHAGLRPSGSSIPYATSKAALNHLTKLLAKTLGPDVRVNAIAPGLVDTPWTADWHEVRAAIEAVAPLRRSGQPADIASLAVAMAANTYLTGQILAVDGGLGLTGF